MSEAWAPKSAGRPTRREEPRFLTRREVLSGAAQVALGATLAGSASLALVACAVPVGEPWQDETFWADGTGWIEA